MRTVNVMFDTLCRRFLSNYGNDWIQTPNFQRLEQHCTRFENFYGGSMPCMPARRELHTGRYNFLHRSWSPLEPFDFSVQEELRKHGVYTHLVTDHSHYWEDGGATYHERYSSWEGFRGQEGDRWQPQDYGIVPEGRSVMDKTENNVSVVQHYANRTKMRDESEMPCVRTFTAGTDFIRNHVNQDNWFLQIESFDPHEPFYVPQKYRDMYDLKDMPRLDWPAYGPVKKDMPEDQLKEELHEMRLEYAALVTMCDHYLGTVLDLFDEYDLWKDTALIVNTDHGFLLGEHELLGKNFPPMYDELIHLPFFMHVPEGNNEGVRQSLCSTIDIAPTLLELYGIDSQEDFDGASLISVQKEDKTNHDHVIFGVHGGSVGITDGRYVYFRANEREDNQPVVECTLMPTNMRGFMNQAQLNEAVLMDGNRFTHGMKYLKVPAKSYMNPKVWGDLLFDLETDPEQKNNLLPHAKESELKSAMIEIMKKTEAPEEEFLRLGL